ncbi:MAG: hypothetical protein FWD49_00860 [Firmicutes bacterium]|nr:hypothetical protein [Bacillota bacterium]
MKKKLQLFVSLLISIAFVMAIAVACNDKNGNHGKEIENAHTVLESAKDKTLALNNYGVHAQYNQIQEFLSDNGEEITKDKQETRVISRADKAEIGGKPVIYTAEIQKDIYEEETERERTSKTYFADFVLYMSEEETGEENSHKIKRAIPEKYVDFCLKNEIFGLKSIPFVKSMVDFDGISFSKHTGIMKEGITTVTRTINEEETILGLYNSFGGGENVTMAEEHKSNSHAKGEVIVTIQDGFIRGIKTNLDIRLVYATENENSETETITINSRLDSEVNISKEASTIVPFEDLESYESSDYIPEVNDGVIFDFLKGKIWGMEFYETTVTNGEETNIFGVYSDSGKYYYKNGEKLFYSYIDNELGKRLSYVNTGLEKFLVMSEELYSNPMYKEDIELFIPKAIIFTALNSEGNVAVVFDNLAVTVTLTLETDTETSEIITLNFDNTEYKSGKLTVGETEYSETISSLVPRLPLDLNTYTEISD